MSPGKWRYFRIAFVVFAIVASVTIYEQGGFESMGLVGFGILVLALVAVGLALYFYLKDEPDDSIQD